MRGGIPPTLETLPHTGIDSLRRDLETRVSVQFKFGPHLLPGGTWPARVSLDRCAEFHEVFHIFEPLPEFPHFRCKRLKGRFFKGCVTHRLLFGL